MATNGLAKAAGLLAVPDQFIQTAMQFPEKVDEALALLDSVPDVAELLSKANALEHYAHRIKVDGRVIKPIQYGKLKIEAKLGSMVPPPSKGGRGKETVKHLNGFTRPTIATYRKVANHSAMVDGYFRDAMADDEVEMSTAGFIRYVASDGNLKAHQNKGVIEWYTPADYVEAARKTMGAIDLDPASNKKAQQVVQAAEFFTKADDGLAKDWSGSVFLNPPFNRAAAFVEKLCKSHEGGSVPQAILLTNNNTDTAWWHQAVDCSSAVCFTKGRIPFYSPAGESAKPTNGHTLFYLGSRCKPFAKEFGRFGSILTAYSP